MRHIDFGTAANWFFPDDYEYNGLCNLKGHDWIKYVLKLDEEKELFRHCQRCSIIIMNDGKEVR